MVERLLWEQEVSRVRVALSRRREKKFDQEWFLRFLMIFIIKTYIMVEIINTSETISKAIVGLYGYDNGRTRKMFNKYVTENNINIDHLSKKPFKYKRITKICPVCGNSFITESGSTREKITCSHSCSNTYFRSGINNPNWSDDRYRSTCFIYHEKECIICGEKNIVAVHHYDENKKNNNPENLIPMCPTHHQYMHSNFKSLIDETVNRYRDEFIKKFV